MKRYALQTTFSNAGLSVNVPFLVMVDKDYNEEQTRKDVIAALHQSDAFKLAEERGITVKVVNLNTICAIEYMNLSLTYSPTVIEVGFEEVVK
ncbi:MAG: hypothetical protein RR280_08505 [Bacteroidaceae bacterium]